MSMGEQTMRVGYVTVSKGGQGIVGNVASGEGLFSEFCSCYGSQHRTTVPEFEYEAGGEFGVLISVYQIPEHF